jgi:hypothetical protein
MWLSRVVATKLEGNFSELNTFFKRAIKKVALISLLPFSGLLYFSPDFNEYLEHVMEELPKDYDILYLGYKDLFRCEPPKNEKFNYIYKPYYPLLTHAMIISNKGLKKLIKIIKKIDYHIDWKIGYNTHKLNIYASKKKLLTNYG